MLLECRQHPPLDPHNKIRRINNSSSIPAVSQRPGVCTSSIHRRENELNGLRLTHIRPFAWDQGQPECSSAHRVCLGFCQGLASRMPPSRHGAMDSMSGMPVDDHPRRVRSCHQYPV
eukprot:scaffold122518_cov15-Prasinocladus_malaysianus.AAC.1